MDAARRVLDTMARIEELERVHAPPADVLSELARLVVEAQEWAFEEGGEAPEAAVARLRAALTRDMIGL